MMTLEQLEAEVRAIREARLAMTIAADHAPTLGLRDLGRQRAAEMHRERAASLNAKVVHLIAFHDIDAKAYCLAASKVMELLP